MSTTTSRGQKLEITLDHFYGPYPNKLQSGVTGAHKIALDLLIKYEII